MESLPSESAADSAVQQFGLGPYDSDLNRSGGEDSEGVSSEKNSRGKSVPDAGGSSVSPPETMQSYPETVASIIMAAASLGDLIRLLAVDMLPGDIDAGTTHQHPDTGFLDSPVPSVSQSELPNDGDNPSSRSDYYDHMSIGQRSVEDDWADEDSGAYAAAELPGQPRNDVVSDNGLSGTGNAWSGNVTQDQSGETGHPTEDFLENVDYSGGPSGGTLVASRGNMRKIASDAESIGQLRFETIGQLAKDFLKEHGRKDLTRRHVMAFLTAEGEHQYLCSAVIRCLKLRHGIFLKDVLDEFPTVKTASGLELSSVRDRLIEFEAVYLARPEAANVLRRCAAAVSSAIADLERLGSS